MARGKNRHLKKYCYDLCHRTFYLCSLLGVLRCRVLYLGASQAAQTVNNLPTMQETQVQSLGREDPLEKEKATHSSSLAWGIPWTQPLTHSEFLFIYGVRECFNFIDIHVAAQLSKQHSLQK